MALYATRYNDHGLKHADVRTIWFDLFEEYRGLSEVHVVSKIVTVGWGYHAIIDLTLQREPVGPRRPAACGCRSQLGHEETHDPTREGGVQRIRGSAGETRRVLPFGTARYPLF